MKSSDAEIRSLVPADAAAYRALRLRGLREHPDAFTSSHDEEAARPMAWTEARLAPDADGMMWGAFVDGHPVGAIGLLRDPRTNVRHKADVFGMYVAQEHSGRGIGQALLSQLIRIARHELGLEQLYLTVTDSNTWARTLYEKVGFRSFGVEPRAIRVGGTYYDKNHMILFLAQP